MIQRSILRAALPTLVGVLLLTGSAAGRGPGRPSATTRPANDGATSVKDLQARPLLLPHLRKNEHCPRPRLERVTTGVAPGVSAGPVTAVGLGTIEGVGIGRVVTDVGWREGKILWLVQRSQREPVIVRGRRIDRRGQLRFRFGAERGSAVGELSGDVNSTAGADYRDIPSSIQVHSAGCYAIQVDGPGFQSIITLRVAASTA